MSESTQWPSESRANPSLQRHPGSSLHSLSQVEKGEDGWDTLPLTLLVSPQVCSHLRHLLHSSFLPQPASENRNNLCNIRFSTWVAVTVMATHSSMVSFVERFTNTAGGTESNSHRRVITIRALNYLIFRVYFPPTLSPLQLLSHDGIHSV